MELETKVSAEETVRKAYDAYNHHDLDAYFAHFDPDVIIHDPFSPAPVKGREVSRKLNEIPPTDRRFEYAFAAFYRVNAKGLISEVHNYYDAANLRQQLGMKA